MKESEYSKIVVDRLKAAGAVVNVNTASIYDKIGRSDVEACYMGRYLALELKTGNYQPDPLQIEYLKDIRNAGGIGLLLRDSTGIAMLDDVLNLIYNGCISEFKQPDLPNIEIGDVIYD